MGEIKISCLRRGCKIIALLFASFLFVGVNLRADDPVIQSPDDLSPADQVAAEHLQKQLDADAKAAHDKADKEWYQQHYPGGDSSSLILPFVVVLLIVGAVVYSKNKTAGKIYAGCCVAMVVFIAILALTEQSPPPVQPTAVSADPPKPSPQEISKARAAEQDNLQKELADSENSVAKKIQRLNWVKQQVAHYWQQYQADSTILNPATGLYDKRPEYQTAIDGTGLDGTSQYYYEKWLADYQKESDELSELKKNIIATLQKMGLSTADGLDPSTGLPLPIDSSTGIPIYAASTSSKP
jgi:hypothetical protein